MRMRSSAVRGAVAGHPRLRVRAESAAAAATEAPHKTEGSGGNLAAVFVALLRRR